MGKVRESKGKRKGGKKAPSLENWLKRNNQIFYQIGERMYMAKIRGYAGLGDDLGTFVPEEEAFQYAMQRVQWSDYWRKEFVDWFYSGDWVPEEREEDE